MCQLDFLLSFYMFGVGIDSLSHSIFFLGKLDLFELTDMFNLISNTF